METKINIGRIIDPDVTKELFKTIPDSRLPVVRMAQEMERKVFTYCLFMGISKVYMWTETRTDGNMWSMEWRFDEHRPSGHYCTEHDFTNLLEMSDEEFDKLPTSPNTGLVKSWREMMKKEKK